MKSFDIVGYTFRADLYCSDCIVAQVCGGEVAFTLDTELVLDDAADAKGIDRQEEHTFDSDDFPKVIFAGMIDGDECCGSCHEPFLEP